MNEIYSLTSSHFEGEVLLTFDDNGILTGYDTSRAVLTDQQKIWLAGKLPKFLTSINSILGESPTAKLTSIKQEVTFDQFWNRYDEKIRSSKKKAQAKWNKMGATDRFKAYSFITQYERNIIPGMAKKYAETYLSAELWNN